jgi:hypothetical protein
MVARKIFIVLVLPLIVACTNESKKKHAMSHVTNQDSFSTDSSSNKTLCFLKLDGTQNQDSTYIYIHLKGDSISGLYNWIPEMKDARRGIINGIKREDTLNVVWSYMQEGMTNTIHTQFLLDSNNLKQQPFLTLEDGQQVRDRNAQFDIVYNSTGCPVF